MKIKCFLFAFLAIFPIAVFAYTSGDHCPWAISSPGNCTVNISGVYIGEIRDENASSEDQKYQSLPGCIKPGAPLAILWQSVGISPDHWYVRYVCAGNTYDLMSSKSVIGRTRGNFISWIAPSYSENSKYCKIWIEAKKGGNISDEDNETLGSANSRPFAICAPAPSSPAAKINYYMLTKGGNKCLAFGQFESLQQCREELSRKYGPLADGQCFENYAKCFVASAATQATCILDGQKRLSSEQYCCNGSETGVGSFCLSANALPSTQNNYYFCEYREKKCYPFGGFYNLAECQKELRKVYGDRTTQICYSSYDSCDAGCKPETENTFYYCLKGAQKCYPSRKYSANISLYARQQCRTDLAKYYPNLTTGECYDTSELCEQQCATKKTYSFCLSDIGKCQETSQQYLSAEECQSSLERYWSGKTTGICYKNLSDCSSNCSSSSAGGRQFVYCNTDIKKCLEVDKKFESKADCAEYAKNAYKDKILNGCYEANEIDKCLQDCTKSSEPEIQPQNFYYCILASKSCDHTFKQYKDATTCEGDLTKYLGSYVDGKCYSKQEDCAKACGFVGPNSPPESENSTSTPPNTASAVTLPASYISANFAFLEGKISDAATNKVYKAWFELIGGGQTRVLPQTADIAVSSTDSFFFPAFNLKAKTSYSYTVNGKYGDSTVKGANQTFITP